jgi:hypothetical protein
MRRLLSFALVGGLVWWFFGRRREEAQHRATIGYADGSCVTLEAGSPELDRLVQIAAEATTA